MDELHVYSGKKNTQSGINMSDANTGDDGGEASTEAGEDAASDNNGSEGCTQSKRRKKSHDSREIKKLMGDLMSSTHKAFGEVTRAIIQPATNTSQAIPDDDEKKQGLYQEIVVLLGLSLDHVLWATCHLANNRNDMLAFVGVPFEVRGAFILSLIGTYNQ